MRSLSPIPKHPERRPTISRSKRQQGRSPMLLLWLSGSSSRNAMESSASRLSILPNLSIGVVAVGGLVYVVIQFLHALDKRAERHEAAMAEREKALRDVEHHV